MMKQRIRMLLALAACALAPAALAAGVDDLGRDVREWNFRVFLDDSEIGYHRFELIRQDDTRRITTEADFRVGFLFLTAYRYEHVNEETWEGECLREIASRTDDNGREFAVRGLQRENHFAVTAGAEPTVVDDCVKTFAYWNPAILEEDRLLNSQTGELLPVTVERVAREVLDVKGEEVSTVRYRLSSHDLELDIWYSDQDEWLALESTVKGGRKLRYELT
jgi:hypothetical protein